MWHWAAEVAALTTGLLLLLDDHDDDEEEGRDYRSDCVYGGLFVVSHVDFTG